MKTQTKLRTITAALGLVLCAAPLAASSQTDGSPLVCGVHRILSSKVLGEERSLLIRLPEDYGQGNKHYPVLYKLDGDQGNFVQACSAAFYLFDWMENAPDAIVVGIPNTEGHRGRDLEPEQGADRFLQFLKTELVPFIEANYRTNGFRIVAGQSASSCFALYSFLKEPALFDAYLLSSFGLHVESRAVLFAKELKANPELGEIGRKYFFVGNGKKDAYDPDGSRTKRGELFLESLKQTVPGTVRVKQTRYDDEGHVPFPTLYDGLKWVYTEEKAAGR